MQNMVVGSFIENIKTKIFIKFHFINFTTYLARVANSMVIFSASYWVFLGIFGILSTFYWAVVIGSECNFFWDRLYVV